MVGAVLAGGEGRRMGRRKATVEVAGVPMAVRVAEAMRGAGAAEVVLVGGDPAEGAALGLEVVDDRWPGAGPLAGLATAAAWASGRGAGTVLVAACDQPNLTAALFSELSGALTGPPTDRSGAVVETPDGRTQPFPAAWSTSVAADLEALVEQGHRRADAAHAIGVARVAAPVETVIDVDRPTDLAAAERALDETPRPET